MHAQKWFSASKARLLKLEKLHRPVVWVIQIAVFSLCGLSAFLLRFDFGLPARYRVHFLYALLIWVLAKTVVFRLLRLDHGWLRYVSVLDVHRLLMGNLAASVLSSISIVILAPPGFPRSIYLLDFLLCFLATSALRVTLRIVQELLRQNGSGDAKRVLIYGAGAAGAMLLREIAVSPSLHYRVCGFVDDDPSKRNLNIQGIQVRGRGVDLPEFVPKHKIQLVLIALPSATGRQIASILERCHSAGVPCKTMPGLADIIEGRALTSQIRDVAVEDLLGRTPVQLKVEQIRARLQDRVVMVTGAAGSIGSELCRQIARFRPRAIVGYEISETALFELDLEMRQLFPGLSFHPEIGSIQNPHRLSDVFRKYFPSIVYHAAAYKHVPMMETHPFEAVENNVFGTYNVAVAAAQHGVEDFVMISSDKAVRPTSIMGATKRVAELLILSLQNGETKFVSVRFGNVLGSNGSVVPLFKRQIAVGGPVTVTHPEMRRYFMTIPEAAQLVLQASTMGTGGDIFVLDMGEPVRIVDLARNLILLSGLRPGEDIKIQFTGVRPGEKLYEELSTLDEDTLPTFHEKIKIFAGNGLPASGMTAYVDELRDICAARDAARLILILKDIVPDYNPSSHVLRRMLETKAVRALTAIA